MRRVANSSQAARWAGVVREGGRARSFSNRVSMPVMVGLSFWQQLVQFFVAVSHAHQNVSRTCAGYTTARPVVVDTWKWYMK
jgi:hypothetical protein